MTNIVNDSLQGKIVVVVTHDRSIARVADVRLEKEDGRINTVSPVRLHPPVPVRKKKGKKK